MDKTQPFTNQSQNPFASASF